MDKRRLASVCKQGDEHTKVHTRTTRDKSLRSAVHPSLTPMEDRVHPFPRDEPESHALIRHYRAIWISDVHLGWKPCQADRLLHFLRHHEADRWYLVGDFVDGWMLKRSWFWPQAHNDVVQKMLRIVRKGAHVTCVPGNHDDFLSHFLHLQFGGITIVPEAMHVTADGRTLWILHGDAFDSIVHYAPWLASVGNNGYDFMIVVGRCLNYLRRILGCREWSLAGYVKGRVKNIMKFTADYEHALAQQAKKRNADGVVCGHIHKAEIREVEGVFYYNTGDWVENCTALVEHDDGQLEIVRWPTAEEAKAEDP